MHTVKFCPEQTATEQTRIVEQHNTDIDTQTADDNSHPDHATLKLLNRLEPVDILSTLQGFSGSGILGPIAQHV